MSKRFGRNQRRRAREQIAQLNDTRRFLERKAMDIAYDLAEMRSDYDEARRLAGPLSMLFPVDAKAMEAGKRSTDHGPVQIDEPNRDSFVAAAGIDEISRFVSRMTLTEVVASIAPQTLDRNIHVRLRYADGEVGYGIASRDWMRYTKEQRIAYITGAVAPMLVRQLAKENLL